MKRSFCWIAAIAVITALSGCSSSSDDAAKPVDTAPAKATTAPPSSPQQGMGTIKPGMAGVPK